MFEKTPSKAYHAAVSKMQKAEEKYSSAIDALCKAKSERRVNDVPGLRRKASEAENELKEVLKSASGAWAVYWQARRQIYLEQLLAVVPAIRYYDAIGRIFGESPASPAFVFLQAKVCETTLLSKDAMLGDSGVPVESPDSEVLESCAGAWRL